MTVGIMLILVVMSMKKITINKIMLNHVDRMVIIV